MGAARAWRLLAASLERIGGARLAEFVRSRRARARLAAAARGAKAQDIISLWPSAEVPWPRKFARNERRGGRLTWIHAASVGEGLCAVGIVGKLLERDVETHVLVTCSSASALAVVPSRVRVRQPDAMERVSFGLAPLDFPHRVDCFLEAWKPDLVIWVESEFWPCTLHALHERQTPMILVNARLSQRSMTRWQLFSWSRALLASTLGCFDAIVARSDQDAKRIETALRAAPGLLSTRKPPPLIDAVVDLKTDDPFAFQEKSAVQSVDKVLMPIASTLRQRAWIAGSTHAGEEMELAKAHAELSSSRYGHTNLVTFIAPRHPERCPDALQDVRRALADVEIEPMVLLWSELAHQDAQLQNLRQSSCIIIVDSLGILAHLYRYVDVAFIGGSLPVSRFKGVHNAREALFAGCSLVLQGSAAQSIEPLVSGVVAVEDHVDLASRVHARLEKRLADPMPQQAAYVTNSSAKSALAALSIVWEIILREERSHR